MYPVNLNTTHRCDDLKRGTFCSVADSKGLCLATGRCGLDGMMDACVPMGMPTDPVAHCVANHSNVQTFGKIVKLVPIIWPKMKTLFGLEMMFTIPAGVLGLLGLCWGWALYEKIGLGYAFVPESGQNAQTSHWQELQRHGQGFPTGPPGASHPPI